MIIVLGGIFLSLKMKKNTQNGSWLPWQPKKTFKI